MRYNIALIAEILKTTSKIKIESEIMYLSVDSRKIVHPETTLFFALKTSTNDGQNYIDDLYRRGTKNFVVSKIENNWEQYDANFILVEDPLRALQKIAEYHRSQFDIPVIGITGSNGKTIVKEWLCQLLGQTIEITHSPRSYNSQIGVPLSICLIDDKTELAIIEAGISLPGEMRFLQKIIDPTIGIFTGLGEAHQKNFSDYEEKCEEKFKLFTDCEFIVYREDNPIVKNCAEKSYSNNRLIGWTTDKNSESPYKIELINRDHLSTLIRYSFLGETGEIRIPFIDDASFENAAHCLVLLHRLGYWRKEILDKFASLHPVSMRLEVRDGKRNCMLINDTYNSDPTSVRIALDFLVQRSADKFGEKILILSDFIDTKRDKETLYLETAKMISESGISKLFAIGKELHAHRSHFKKIDYNFYNTTRDFIQSNQWRNFSDSFILLKGARNFHFERIVSLLEEKSHDTVLEVDLDAIIENYNTFKSGLNENVKCLCMMKANAYGHGALEIAKTLQYHRCDYLGVAIAGEGVELREGGVSLPILVLNPEKDGFEELYENRLEPEIYNFRIFDAYLREAQRRGVIDFPIHIKLDTGMHRLGFTEEQIDRLIEKIKGQNCFKIVSIFSHLAGSEDWDFDEFTLKQIKSFDEMSSRIRSAFDYEIYSHILNSAGIERFSGNQFDMVRLGIGLYGVSPSNETSLRNVSSLKSTIIHIQKYKEGESIGYDRKEMLQRDAVIATIRIGYADGLDRRNGNRVGNVLVNGVLAPIVGNICMDLTMIDITNIDARIGDSVVIFGKDLPVSEISDNIDTIPYEIFTSISHRIKRIYTKE